MIIKKLKASGLISALTAVVLSVSMLFGCGSAPAEGLRSSCTAEEMAKRMGLGLNLGNTMEAHHSAGSDNPDCEWVNVLGDNTPADYEVCWGAVETTQEIIDGMKESGFSTVRIPVFWGNMMENDGSYEINSRYIKRVKEIVDYCDKADLIAVINCHHFDEFVIRRNSIEDCVEIFTKLWTQIAEYFKDYNYNLVFEGYNEYLGGAQFNEEGELAELSQDDAYRLTNSLNQAFVDAVRSTGSKNSDRVLIISGYNTNIDRTTSDRFIVPSDSAEDRLMVSVHYVDNAMYWSKNIGSQEWLDYTDSQIALLEEAFISKGIPVFMGECTGMYPPENFSDNRLYSHSSECLEIVLTKLLEKGIVPVIWDTNGGLYSRTEYKIPHDFENEVIKELSDIYTYSYS